MENLLIQANVNGSGAVRTATPVVGALVSEAMPTSGDAV
jgi:hypothetical protein